jgi:uroporphyrinogen decarboxylase
MWFHPETQRRLSRRLEIPESRLAEVMGNDIVQTWVNNNFAMEGIVHTRDGEGHVDDWGIRWIRKEGFNQIAEHPLARMNEEELRSYFFPEAMLERLICNMEAVIRNTGQSFVGCDVSPCVFEMYWRLRGMENTLLDLAADPDLAFQMMGRCADFAVKLGQLTIQRFSLDWLWTGDDVGNQISLMMSPSTWRKLIKPHLGRVFALGKLNGLWVAYHSCGAIRTIIPDLIEMGLDVLNPIQGSCPGMNPFELKKEFGGRLAFMGGIDTQELLPKGSVDQVRRATAGLLEKMTEGGGGYILAASHTIPPETPDDNIFAIYESAGICREEIFDRAAAIRKEPSKLRVY